MMLKRNRNHYKNQIEKIMKLPSRNILLAFTSAIVVLIAGYLVVSSHAATYFAATEAEGATLAGNVQKVSDTGASGGQAIQFNAPATPPSGGGGGTTPPPPGSTTCPVPAYPDASCTGVPAGTSLTVVNGDLTVSTDNTVVSGKDVRGCILVEAVGVKILNSKAQCIYNADNARARNPANAPLTVTDSEINCGGAGAPNNSGISDRNYVVYRMNIHNCENGFDADSDVAIYDSYIHDLYTAADAPGSPHTDGLQSAGGSNIIISHNTFYGFDTGCHPPNNGSCNGTSAINICNSTSSSCSGIHDTTISSNLLAGGAVTLYCPKLSTTNFKIVGNHFSTVYSPSVGEFGPSTDCSDDISKEISNGIIPANVYHETGLAITLD